MEEIISVFLPNLRAEDCSLSRKQKNDLEVGCISGFLSNQECSMDRNDMAYMWNAAWI